MRICNAILAAAFVLAPAYAQDAGATWKALLSITGEWAGEAEGEPGAGQGVLSLRPELDGAVLVRHGTTDFPSTSTRPASTHRDLTIVYRRGAQVRADYWDNEKHLISYVAGVSADGQRITFVSDAETGAPRFRLTYVKLATDQMRIDFGIAPPGKPGEFTTHVGGTLRRKPSR